MRERVNSPRGKDYAWKSRGGSLKISSLFIALFAVVALLGHPSFTRAELPAPTFMPGFPMLAGNQIMIMWNPVPGAVKYHVYINGEKVSEPSAMQFFYPVPEGKTGTFEITVKSVDSNGAEGTPSKMEAIKIEKLEPPTGIVGLATGDDISLRWEQAPSAVIYNVYRSNLSGSGYSLLGSVQDNAFRDQTAKRGNEYYYVVTSKNIAGEESAYSEEVKLNFEKIVGAKITSVKKMFTEEVYAIKDLANGAGDITPGGLFVHEESDRIYVVNKNPATIQVYKYSNGAPLTSFGTPYRKRKEGEDPTPSLGELGNITSISYDPKRKELYVFCPSQNYYQVFTLDGTPVRMGKYPEGRNDLGAWARYPYPDGSGKYMILNPAVRRLIIYDENDRELGRLEKYQYPDAKTKKLRDYNPPTGPIAFDSEGNFYVGDGEQNYVIKYGTDLKIGTRFGGRGLTYGKFTRITDIEIDGEDRIYAAEWVSGTVQVFDTEGNLLYLLWGNRRTPEKNWDAGNIINIYVNDKGDEIVIAQPLHNRLSKFQITGESIEEEIK